MLETLQPLTVQHFIMYMVGGILIYLAIKKRYEPEFLLPMGFGAILVNLPGSSAISQKVEGIGEVKGVIGAADGPTSILVSQILKSNYVGAIAVAAYSYMALVPIIQPITIKCITTQKERRMQMPHATKSVSKRARILFPIIVTVVAGLLAPMSLALVGFLMFGNLIREFGVLEKQAETARENLAQLITLLLGITISYSMRAEVFVRMETLIIMAIGLVVFVFDTIGGVLVAKIMNLFLKNKINPMIGAAGISAFPMSSRVVQRMAQEEVPGNIILMHAAGANVAGQIGSAIVGGLLLSLFAVVS